MERAEFILSFSFGAEIKPRASRMLGKHCTTELHPNPRESRIQILVSEGESRRWGTKDRYRQMFQELPWEKAGVARKTGGMLPGNTTSQAVPAGWPSFHNPPTLASQEPGSQICTTNVQLRGYFFFFGSIGAWTQGLTLARQVVYHLSHSTCPIFKIVSHKLFSWAGLEPQSSWSLPLV
jgi:hypothetical protein